MSRHKHSPVLVIAAALLALGPARLRADELGEFLEKISSADKEVRYAARLGAGKIGVPAVAPLAKLMVEGTREVSISALRALETIVHAAGRPGRTDDARAVSAEIAALLTGATTRDVKLELLNLIAFVGDDAVVENVASMLEDGDRHVREAARTALERIPGRQAIEALIRAARRADETRRGDFLFSLGKKGDGSAVPFLVSNTTDPSAAVRTSALEALAHLGAPEAVARFERELSDEDAPHRAGVVKEYLRLADNLALTGHRDIALRIYEESLAAAPLDHQRERALFQLSHSKGPRAVDALIAGLADPAARVHQLAMRRLAAMEGEEIAAALRQAYLGAERGARPFLLRAIARSDPEGAKPLLDDAIHGGDAEVKVTALDIRGELAQPGLEATFVELAERGSPAVRETAVKGYLALALARLKEAEDGGERESAVRTAGAMFSKVLEIAADDSQKAEAIDGIREIGRTDAVEKLEPYLAHPTLGSTASRVYVGLAEKVVDDGNIDRAEALLSKVLEGDFPRALKERAADKLRDAGRDPQRAALKQGFVLDWRFIGPLRDEDDQGLARSYFPETSRPDDKEHRIGPRRYRWQHPRLLTTSGVIDLAPLFRRSEHRLCYAYAEIVSPKEAAALFKIGSDDGVACWLNGERIHFNPVSRGLTVDEDVVEARLKEGQNVVLVKVNNVGGTWQLSFRITDAAGKPLVLEVAEPAVEPATTTE